jgi:hypothetical protein
MKLVKSLVLGAGLLCAGMAAQAQTTGTTTMHVKINDVLSIAVNHPNVTLTFSNPNDYINGRDTTLTSHLTVTSNQAFDVNVKSGSANLTASSNTIAASVVKVEVASSSTGLGTAATAQSLAATDITLIDEAPGQANRSVDMRYYIPAATSSSSAILGKPAGDYTATLTYTILVD